MNCDYETSSGFGRIQA